MSLGLVGRKIGMTRIFSDEGVSTPVTLIEVEPNRVSQIKTVESDGYVAVQVVTGVRRSRRVTRPMVGHCRKAKVEVGRGAWEFRLDSLDGINLGNEFKVDIFKVGQIVDVSGFSKGKGFQGGVKRHNFRMQDATHGNSVSHRANGSIGQNQTPGRVFKGKKMSGQMGAAKCSAQSLRVVRVDVKRNLVLIKGAVPGAKGGDVIIRPGIKQN